MSKPMQYLPVGLPYSGKTTIAKRLEASLGFKRVNLDEAKAGLGFGAMQDDKISSEDWLRIFELTNQHVVDYLKQGFSVVHETDWVDRPSLDRSRQLATNLGLETVVIWVDTPIEVCRQRMETNRFTNERFGLSNNVFNQALQEWQPPTADENVIVYRPEDDFESWLEANIKINHS